MLALLSAVTIKMKPPLVSRIFSIDRIYYNCLQFIISIKIDHKNSYIVIMIIIVFIVVFWSKTSLGSVKSPYHLFLHSTHKRIYFKELMKIYFVKSTLSDYKLRFSEVHVFKLDEVVSHKRAACTVINGLC